MGRGGRALLVGGFASAVRWSERVFLRSWGEVPHPPQDVSPPLASTHPPCVPSPRPNADEELKWLDWPQYLALCGELRRECAGRDAAGRRRQDTAVAQSLQRYLIFAILSCIPDRQVGVCSQAGVCLYEGGGGGGGRGGGSRWEQPGSWLSSGKRVGPAEKMASPG